MKLKLNRKQLIITAIGVVLVGATGGYFLWGRRASTEEFITAKVERGAIRNTVSATGTLQAVTTVQVGSQVSGTISELFADFNTVVKKGQLVAQLDPRVYEAQLASQRANLEQARASMADAEARVLAAEATVETQRAGVSGASANLAALKAQRDDALSLLRRQEALSKDGIIPVRDMESARTSYNAADARYSQAASQLDQARVSERTSASSGLAQAKAQVKQARAQIQQIEGSLKMAEVNLSYTTITSPIDGVVVSRNVDKGQTVAASLQAPTLFTIANDLTQMQVIANIDQADIGVINQTNRVSFTVDAFPGNNFSGTINQIRLSPQNVQNVITYNVVIDVKNPELKLKPGMTANLTITIAERQDTLKIPNAALRFRPQGMTPEKMRELFRGGPRPEGGADGAKDAAKGPGQNPEEGGPRQAGNNERSDAQGAQGGDGDGERRRGRGRGNRGDGRQGAPDGAQRGGAGGNTTASVAATPPVPSTTPIQEGQVRAVWVLGPDKKPQFRRIRLGITDGTATEVIEGDLKEGDIIIVSQTIAAEDRQQNNQQRPPGFGGGMPGGGGGRGGFGGGGGGRR